MLKRSASLLILLLFVSNLAAAQCGGPVPMLCDADGDWDVDRHDIAAIAAGHGSPTDGPADNRDIDGDGVISVLDARQCVALCD